MTNTSKIVLGLVGAAAVGVAVGLLLAPEKGIDTRKKLSSSASDWGQQLADIFANAKSEVEKLTNKGIRVAGNTANKYSSVANNFS